MNKFNDDLIKYIEDHYHNGFKNKTLIAKMAHKHFEMGDDYTVESLRRKISKHIQTSERKKDPSSNLLVIDPADIHIGKLATSFETGEDYNNQIAVQRVKEGVKGILDKSSGFNIDAILFIAGNDILHIDTPKRTTSAGTPQDTDGMWYENFLIAKRLYIDVLDSLINVA